MLQWGGHELVRLLDGAVAASDAPEPLGGDGGDPVLAPLGPLVT